MTTLYLARVDRERTTIDSRLYISAHDQQGLSFNTGIHAVQQQATVCMLNHPSQLKTLLSGSKLPDSDLLLTSNPNPDKLLTTTFQSTLLQFLILQNEGSFAFIFFFFFTHLLFFLNKGSVESHINLKLMNKRLCTQEGCYFAHII